MIIKVKDIQKLQINGDQREREFNVSLDTLQVISETVLQAITCTGTDNKN